MAKLPVQHILSRKKKKEENVLEMFHLYPWHKMISFRFNTLKEIKSYNRQISFSYQHYTYIIHTHTHVTLINGSNIYFGVYPIKGINRSGNNTNIRKIKNTHTYAHTHTHAHTQK